MNTIAIAAALRALADAIESPSPSAPTLASSPTTPPSASTAASPAAAQPATTVVRPRGRPPGSSAKPASPAASATTAPSAVAGPAAVNTAPPVATTPGNSALTHAAVANDFKAAALAHGRDFVKGLLTAHNAPTFDKVKDLAAFQAQLKAGPGLQAAPAPAVDAADLLG